MLGTDFVLETSPEIFSKWLISEIMLPDYGYVLSGRKYPLEILYIADARFLPPSPDWPHVSFVADGFIFKPKNKEEHGKIKFEEEKGFRRVVYMSAEGIEREDIGTVVQIDIKEVGENKIHVSAQYNEEFPHLRDCLSYLSEQIRMVYLPTPTPTHVRKEKKVSITKPRMKRGPNATTQRRAKVIKRIKDDHPEYSRVQVAEKASIALDDLGVTGEAVRYIYRINGWDWQRADRIR